MARPRALWLAPLCLCLAMAPVAAAPATGPAPAKIPPAVAAALPPLPTERVVTGEFVRVRNGQFTLAGRPFRFVGANVDPLHGDRNRPVAQQLIAGVASDGLTVARIWALGEGGADADDWLRHFQLFRFGPYAFLEDSYVLLDNVLAAARHYGVRVILTLSNNWGDYGGVPQYLRWAGTDPSGLNQEAFYSHPRTREFYRAGLLKLLLRRNTVTGVRYVDDPAIFAWELMNESVVLTERGRAARIAWIREMAAFIREYDPNHMISAGLLGYSTRRDRDEWLRVMRLPEVDYADSHIYPESLEGWREGRGAARLFDLLDDRAALARYVLKKPLVIGEFSFRTDGARTLYGKPRADWFRRFLTHHFKNRGAGALVWLYEPYQLWNGKVRDFGIHIDHPDTLDVRTAVREVSTQVKNPDPMTFGPDNPRIVAAHTAGLQTKLLFDPIVVTPGPAPQPHARWSQPTPDAFALAIPPVDFFQAAFERSGSWAGGQVVHVYAADAGDLTYRFTAPPRAPGPAGDGIDIVSAHLELRLSSEWPGVNAPRDGGSTVEVLIDGVRVGVLDAPPDDGSGDRRQLSITDRAVLSRLSRGVHTLVFRVPYSARANGLAIYGDYRGDEPPPAGEFTPILLRLRLSRPVYLPSPASRKVTKTTGENHP